MKQSTVTPPQIISLQFADSRVPEFKWLNNKDYVLYGSDNDYPEYLTYLYNKSPKHNAIINGKSKYIFGGGLSKRVNSPNGFVAFKDEAGNITPAPAVNRSGETLDDILEKSIKDIEIYGGFRWIIIWNSLGGIADIFHEDFMSFRVAKDGKGYWWKNDWLKKYGKEDAKPYKEFDLNDRTGAQVFAYNEYRPGCKEYPLPGYIGANNYIETDIEISKFHFSSIKNGMIPSKMIQFFTGEPTEEKKKDIERRFEKKFTGAENAGKLIMVYNQASGKSVEINDLSSNDLDKQQEVLNKTCQQEILTGHEVTSPMLFGIKTEGQLGGNTELKTAYEIFINTYAKPKQKPLERMINYFGKLMGKGEDYYFEQLDPVGLQLSADKLVDLLPLEYVYDKLNVPKEHRTPPPVVNDEGLSDELTVNENLKNLTGRQLQQIQRTINKYKSGKLELDAAMLLLKSGYGLCDEDAKMLLGVKFSSQDDEVIQLFNSYGDLKSDYIVIKSKPVKFSSDEEAYEDELDFYQQAFKDVTRSEVDILKLIDDDPKITPEVIGKALGTTTEYVVSKIKSLTKKGLIKETVLKVGEDEIIERSVTKPVSDIDRNTPGEPVEILIKYSYEGPKDSRNRPFCKRLLELDRFYSRYEIELLTQRLGYSVFDRRGGFWTQPDGNVLPYCRHRWVSNVVVKKGGN